MQNECSWIHGRAVSSSSQRPLSNRLHFTSRARNGRTTDDGGVHVHPRVGAGVRLRRKLGSIRFLNRISTLSDTIKCMRECAFTLSSCKRECRSLPPQDRDECMEGCKKFEDN